MKKILLLFAVIVMSSSLIYGNIGLSNMKRKSNYFASQTTVFSKYHYQNSTNLLSVSPGFMSNSLTGKYDMQGSGAAVFGYVASPIVFALSVASALTSDNTMPSLPLGAAAWTLAVVSVPVLGATVDFGNLNAGTSVLYAMSWVGYGFTIIGGGVLIGLGATGSSVPGTVILSTGLLGTVSILGMAVCNQVSHTAYKPQKERKWNLAVAPTYKGAVGGFSYRF